ncbi:MAG: rRNA maturation RNase YbeY [Ruminococcaceae bacterium]|nr:rRNA maturation RNase YbeY [Oscillospiraceae bacterium]
MARHAIYIENEQNKVKPIGKIKELIKAVCAAVLENEGFERKAEISVVLVDNEYIRELNREYRDKDTATDVLSFPIYEDDADDDIKMGDMDKKNSAVLLGDIVISLERAAVQATEFGHSTEREVGYLTAHSVLHLLGYDHMDENERAIMREKEEAALAKLDLKRE